MNTDLEGGNVKRHKNLAVCLVVLIIFSLTKYAMVALLEACLLGLVLYSSSLRQGYLDALMKPLFKVLLIFLGIVGLSSIWSSGSAFEAFHDFWGWRKLLLAPLCYFLFAEEKYKRWLIGAFLLNGTIHLVLSFFITFGILDGGNPRALMENHSVQGVAFALCAYILVHTRTLFPRISSILMVLSFALAICFLINAVFITSGRSGYVAVVILSLVFLWCSWPKRLLTLGPVVLLVLAVMLTLSPVASSRLVAAYTNATTAFTEGSSDTSAGIRVVMWYNTLQMILDKPLLGSGAGGYAHDYSLIVSELYAENDWRLIKSDDPHQQYLHIWARYGLLGLGAFIVFLGLLVKNITSLLTNDVYSFVKIAIGVAAVVSITSFFNGHFAAFVEGRIFWVLVPAMIAGVHKQSLESQS